MSTLTLKQSPTSTEQIDRAVAELVSAESEVERTVACRSASRCWKIASQRVAAIGARMGRGGLRGQGHSGRQSAARPKKSRPVRWPRRGICGC